MKTRLFFIVTALAAINVISCQKENSVIVPIETSEVETIKAVEPNPDFVPTKAMSFVGMTDDELDPETKTSLDGTHIKWAVSEGIYLFDGVAPRAFTSDNDAVASTVNFDGSASDVAKYYAVYPSGKLSTVESKKVITTTIPTFQTATANSFAPKANVAVAYSEADPSGDGALQFKNIGAVVKFKIHADNTDVRKVRLDALGEEDLSGKMTVTFESDGSFSTASVHANSEPCVILESATNLDPSKTYYMAIKPGTYAGGFKLTLIRADGSFRSIKNTSSNTLVRNDLMDFGDLPKIPSWKTSTIDELTFETTGVTSGSSTYTDWSGKTLTSSAVYAGSSAGQNDAIQIRSKNEDSGVYTTTSGGQLAKVSVEWNTNTVAGRTLNIYGKKSAYSSAADLFDADKKGSLLGSIVKGTSTDLIISGDYTFVGMCSDDGALYMDKVSVYWGDVAPVDPAKTVQTTSITSLSSANVPLTSGSATFNIVSNGPYTVSSSAAYASVSVSESDVATVTFENLASGQREATITVTPASGDPAEVTITQKNAPVTKTVTYTQSYSGSGHTVSTTGTAPTGSSCSWTTTYTNSNQLTSGKKMTYTISGFDGKRITGLSLNLKTNSSSGSGTVTMKHGSTSFGSYSIPTIGSTYDLKDATVTATTIGKDEVVTVEVSASANSVYCQYITLSYE